MSDIANAEMKYNDWSTFLLCYLIAQNFYDIATYCTTHCINTEVSLFKACIRGRL